MRYWFFLNIDNAGFSWRRTFEVMTTTQTLFQQNYRNADRIMMGIIWALFVMSLALSSMHDTLKWALLVGLPAAMIPSALIIFSSGYRFTRCVVAAAIMIFAGLHIHQAGGQTEAHFGIFVLLAFLLCYRDWAVIVTAAVVIAVHHLSFNYLQELGYGVICLTNTGIGTVLVHASYVVAESVVLCYLAVILHRDALQSAELRAMVVSLNTGGTDSIDLRSVVAAQSPSGKALHHAVKELRTALAGVNTFVASIATAAVSMASGNTNLASSTTKQAHVLNEVATSIGKFTTAVNQNTESAKDANQLARSASDVAARGQSAVNEVVVTMKTINDSSKKISDITGTIDSIAFQTNILALNAAVEAARAGEQGRGFAVVAGEVRNLAQLSAQAAKEIKMLIGDSVDRIESGRLLADQAGQTMGEVVQSAKQVSDIIGSIAAASEQQQIGIEHINVKISGLEAITRENSVLVEQAASSSISLHEESDKLAKAVSIFKV